MRRTTHLPPPSPLPLSHIDSRLVTFEIYLNVRKGKYLAMRNRLLPGKAGPAGEDTNALNSAHYLLGNASYPKVTFRVT